MTLRLLLACAICLLPASVAGAEPEAGRLKAEACAPCHGAAGTPPSGPVPILAGQTARYTYLQLRDFREGRRQDPAMSAIAATLSREDMLDLADYYAAQRPGVTTFRPDPAKVAAGRETAKNVLCTMCHLGGFAGQNEIPRVAGQHPEYVIKQLKAFKERTRTNDAGTMTSVARTLSDQDMDDLAHYLASLD
jgi:cytochrome c553